MFLVKRFNYMTETSASMYEIFNWGNSNEKHPNSHTLSIMSTDINIDEHPNVTIPRHNIKYQNNKLNLNYNDTTIKGEDVII